MPKANVNWSAFIEPFSYEIWAAILVSILTLSVTWVIAYHISSNDKNESENNTLIFSLFVCLSLICQKGNKRCSVKLKNSLYSYLLIGSTYEPKINSSKIILGIMSFFGTLIFAAYCANLISILLSTKVKAPFNSYDSLYHDTNYEIGYIAGTRIDETLRVIKTLVQTCPDLSEI